MNSKYFTLFFVFFIGSFTAFGQLKTFKKGLANYEAGFYDLAIKELAKVKEIDPTQLGVLNYTLAESFRKSNRYLLALPYYRKAFENGLKNDEAQFYYAFALKENEEYDASKTEFLKFVNANSNLKNLNERANRELNNLQLIENLKSKKSELVFRNLSEINTEGSEFSPIVKNGNLVFSASKKAKIYANGLPFVGLYQAKINQDLTSVSKPEMFSKTVFDEERNEGSATFTPDGKTMVFARGNSGKRKDLSPDVDLFISRLVPNEGWTEPKVISASDSASWDGSPAFSRDGKTLYFSSNRLGGMGSIDIYKVNMDASGRFGNPANMGKVINTAGNEMFPFVSDEGKLYFASDGHAGLGGLDLFVAVRESGKTVVENMGLPFNTAADDFSLSIDESKNIFFSSNRAGGKGDDDIYFYQAPPKPEENVLANTEKNKNKGDLKLVNYYLKGTVKLKSDNELILADSTTLKIYKLEDASESLVFEEILKKGNFGPVKLEEDTDYTILIERSNFLSKRDGFSMFGRSIPQVLLQKPISDTTFVKNMELDQLFVGKTFRLENIYYDLDKFDIRQDAALELDKLVQILKDNPNLKIELGSHTDSQGSDLYNIRLSQKRAESAVNYLVSKGISATRLTAKGYGETELIVKNAKIESEHQTNRRTEFKINEYLKTEEEN